MSDHVELIQFIEKYFRAQLNFSSIVRKHILFRAGRPGGEESQEPLPDLYLKQIFTPFCATENSIRNTFSSNGNAKDEYWDYALWEILSITPRKETFIVNMRSLHDRKSMHYQDPISPSTRLASLTPWPPLPATPTNSVNPRNTPPTCISRFRN